MPLTAADIDAAQHATTTVKAQPPVAAHFAAAKAASNDADKVSTPCAHALSRAISDSFPG